MKKIAGLILPINILICICAIAMIVFMIVFLDFKPCPMCLLQQLCVIIILFFSILGVIKKSPSSFSTVVKIFVILAILYGVYVAADQVYIQYFQVIPVQGTITSCDISSPFLIQATKSITGSVQSCTSISEEVKGVSLAIYSLVFFIFMLFINVSALFVNILKKK
jgi:disulfide bond formation protein DsbB